MIQNDIAKIFLEIYPFSLNLVDGVAQEKYQFRRITAGFVTTINQSIIYFVWINFKQRYNSSQFDKLNSACQCSVFLLPKFAIIHINLFWISLLFWKCDYNLWIITSFSYVIRCSRVIFNHFHIISYEYFNILQ